MKMREVLHEHLKTWAWRNLHSYVKTKQDQVLKFFVISKECQPNAKQKHQHLSQMCNDEIIAETICFNQEFWNSGNLVIDFFLLIGDDA